jgi:hypothetical protein
VAGVWLPTRTAFSPLSEQDTPTCGTRIVVTSQQLVDRAAAAGRRCYCVALCAPPPANSESAVQKSNTRQPISEFRDSESQLGRDVLNYIKEYAPDSNLRGAKRWS